MKLQLNSFFNLSIVFVKKILFFTPFLLFSKLSIGQELPQDYFRSPLDIPIYLAGNFGEIRSGHFHAGLDMKTGGVEGKNIYSAADGYVSRIKIGHGGYGKALYITHPNGYTTTYAHLQKFNDQIESYVKKAQYQKQSYEIELFPSKTQLTLKKGDLIAISGNTGGSGGPHLHFEIRETESEIPVNPLLFGFDIKDDVKPVIKTLGIYPVNGGSLNNNTAPVLLKTNGKDGHYRLATTNALVVTGKIGLGIEVLDRLTGSNNKCGVYSIDLEVDSAEIYCHQMDKIGFHETRYINSHVCFYDWKKNNSKIQRSFIQPNNNLGIYDCNKSTYTIDFKDNNIHHIKYLVRDGHGNVSTLEFDLQSIALEPSPLKEGEDSTKITQLFKYNQENNFKTKDFSLFLPSRVLYEDLLFEYSVSDPINGAITPTHHVQSTYYPLHSHAKLSIAMDTNYRKFYDKSFIVALDENKEFLAAEGGFVNGDVIAVQTRSFGPYTVMIDTVAPIIKPFNVLPGRDMSKKKKIQISIQDELSGIKNYKGTIDDKWVLMEYDYKLNRLTYFFDPERLEKGKKHELKVTVSDLMNNVTDYSINFFW